MTPSAVTRIRLDHFTAFDGIDLRPSSGINVFVGANGTGKTHLMKVAYAACDAARKKERFADKLTRVFLPAEGKLGRLARRRTSVTTAAARVSIGASYVATSFCSRTARSRDAQERRSRKVPDVLPVYIPVKEMLANGPGFRSPYAERTTDFEELYRDLLDWALLPRRGARDAARRRLLDRLRRELGGSIVVHDEAFYWRGRLGRLEFSLLAEGLRKLGLLWLLIENGALREGSVLFWDEPEANLNPKMLEPLVGILLELQRLGVQMFVATHDYIVLKQFDLQQTGADQVLYHALHQDSDGNLACNSTGTYVGIHPNTIDEAFGAIYDSEVTRNLGDRQ